ncbi:MAG TPA: M15 family metallopeptidase, partial [Marinagarivorans sp.]
KIHRDLVDPLNALAADAKQAGFSLGVASGYRSFERQRLIWNAKAAGERPVLDGDEQPLVVPTMPADELMWAILRWSALPGGSRHHWGCDFDIYDAGALSAGAPLALTVIETQTRFAAFYRWLEEYLVSGSDFIRPYSKPGAVACEPWHSSYLPLAKSYQAVVTPEALLAHLRRSDIRLMASIEANFSAIYRDYIGDYFSE